MALLAAMAHGADAAAPATQGATTPTPPLGAPPTPTPSQSPPRRNSLGMTFREVAGTPVFFSVWETRVSDWNAFLADSKFPWSFKPHFAQGNDHPVVNVNLREAAKFCEWLTEKERAGGALGPREFYRLPTSREWDTAIGIAASHSLERATSQKVLDEQTFPWGLEWPPPRQAGNFNSVEINGTDDGFPFTSPAGQFAPSADGLYDLAGNAWEWVAETDARPDAPGKLRGGSWMYFRKECLLSGYEYEVPVDLHAPSIGFRVVLEDKHRTATFLEAQEKLNAESAKKRREQITSRPDVKPEDVARMRDQLTSRPSTTAGPTLPDPGSLRPAVAGKDFMNSLGMVFRPAGSDTVLFCQHETRVQDYEVFLKSTKRTWERRPSFDFKATHPIMNVTWREAKDFCEWLTARDRAFRLVPEKATYRLPTDVEWSLAVGLGAESGSSPEARHLSNKTDYPWGQQTVPPTASANLDTANMAGYQDNYSHTAPVGTFSPNTAHLYDMAGNVAEWCEDPWPSSPGDRTVRGSSYLSSSRDSLLSSARQHAGESSARTDLGFRCVLELPAP